MEQNRIDGERFKQENIVLKRSIEWIVKNIKQLENNKKTKKKGALPTKS